MPRALSWILAVLRWATEPRLAWFTGIVIVSSLIIAIRADSPEPLIRSTGVVLQLLGVGTVAIGVRQTRKLFRHPSLSESTKAWLSRFPRWQRHVVALTGTGHASFNVGKAHLELWRGVDPSATIEAQLAAIAANTEELKKGLNLVRADVQSMQREHSEALRLEQQVRVKEDTALRDQLQAAPTGGIHITLAGVAFLFLGVVLGTLSPEIARWR